MSYDTKYTLSKTWRTNYDTQTTAQNLSRSLIHQWIFRPASLTLEFYSLAHRSFRVETLFIINVIITSQKRNVLIAEVWRRLQTENAGYASTAAFWRGLSKCPTSEPPIWMPQSGKRLCGAMGVNWPTNGELNAEAVSSNCVFLYFRRFAVRQNK